MSNREDPEQTEIAPGLPPAEPLSDTEAEIHEEGKSLDDPEDGLSEKLAEILERRNHD